jgi:uncharacterized protein with PIN domain
MVTNCPDCKVELNPPDELANDTLAPFYQNVGRCPNCNQLFVIRAHANHLSSS